MSELINSEKIAQNTYKAARDSVINAQNKVYAAVNNAMVIAYWEIGQEIYKACGDNDRAEYGKGLLNFLARKLTEEFGKGFDGSNLRKMRQFYKAFPIRDALRPELSWSHYRRLMRIESEAARQFYTEECVKSGWSERQLGRQINSFFYERLLSSQDKKSVSEEIQSLEPKPEYERIIRDPYVLEFLQLEQNPHFYEKELEQAVIDHLQKFLLELGRGFSFVARQKHITFDDRHFYIDLVFYNYILKCFVLIDLKIGDLAHQDLGQMQMYVNFFDRYVKMDFEKPTIGILLCQEKNDALVKLTLPENANIYATEYALYLPNKSLLQRKLKEWIDEFEDKGDDDYVL